MDLAAPAPLRTPDPVTQLPKPASIQSGPLTVHVTREYGLEWFELKLDDGTSEELDPDETRAWFKARGANMDVVEKALDYVWNFGRSTIVIRSPIAPKRSLLDPRV